MNISKTKTKSHIVLNNVDGNSSQINDEFDRACAKNEDEERNKLLFYKKADEFTYLTSSGNTKDDIKETNKKSELNITPIKKVEDSNVENIENLTKVKKPKESSSKGQNTFLGKKTKNPNTVKPKKGKNNFDKIDEEIKKSEKKVKFNSDNSIKEAMKAFLLKMKSMIETSGDFIFNNFDCNDILGGVKQNELVRKSKLYQILGYKDEYRKILENAKPEYAEKFNYFLSSNFGFLFDKYFLNNRKFNINGKEEEVLEFKTLNDEIKRRREKVYNIYDEKEREERINNFIYSSYLVFNDFKDCQQGEVKAKKGLIDYIQNRIEKFEKIYSELSLDQEKGKFINLINKTNEELNNDDTLKSQFCYFEEKEKGFVQFMKLKKIIEEKEEKRNKIANKKKILNSKNAHPNLAEKSGIKEHQKIEKKTEVFKSYEEFNYLYNFGISDKNLEQNSKGQKEFIEQEKFKEELISIDSKICKSQSFKFDSNEFNYIIKSPKIPREDDNISEGFNQFQDINKNFNNSKLLKENDKFFESFNQEEDINKIFNNQCFNFSFLKGNNDDMNPKKFEGNLSMNIYGFPFKKD